MEKKIDSAFNNPPFTNFNLEPIETKAFENGNPIVTKRWFRSITRDIISPEESDTPEDDGTPLFEGDHVTIWLGYTPEYADALKAFIKEKSNIT